MASVGCSRRGRGGARILSAYALSTDERPWIITEADRNAQRHNSSMERYSLVNRIGILLFNVVVVAQLLQCRPVAAAPLEQDDLYCDSACDYNISTSFQTIYRPDNQTVQSQSLADNSAPSSYQPAANTKMAATSCVRQKSFSCGFAGDATFIATISTATCDIDCSPVGYHVLVETCAGAGSSTPFVLVIHQDGSYSGGNLTPVGECAPHLFQYSTCLVDWSIDGIHPPPPETFIIQFAPEAKIKKVTVEVFCCSLLECY